MRKIPSLLALRAFEAAGRLCSFAAAGDELHLTASAISHQIKALEQHFHQALFIRFNRRVELTPGGSRLLAGLTQALDAIEQACAEVAPASATQALALHCAPSFASKWLGPRLPAFMQAHPRISIRMTASADAIDMARRKDVDALIAYGKPIAREEVETEPLGIEGITALCAPALAVRVNPLDPDLLAELPLIESAVSPITWIDWAKANALAAPPKAVRPSFDRGALAIAAAVQGVGVALETTRFAEAELADGTLVNVGHGVFRPIRRAMHFLCIHKAQLQRPEIQAFRTWLLSQCGKN